MIPSWSMFVSWISQHLLLERLFVASLEFAALAAITALVLWLVNPHAPRFIALVWALVLAKPLVSLLLGSPVNLIQVPAPASQPAVAITRNESTTQDSRDGSELSVAQGLSDDGGEITFAPNRQHGSGLGAPIFPSEPRSGARTAALADDKPASATLLGREVTTGWWTWQLSVVVLWLSGVALMAMRALFTRVRLNQILSRGRSPDKTIHDSYLATATALSVRRPPHLLVTDALESPALVGLWRTTILIPEWLANAAKHSALTWTIRHELTHWKHCDLWLIRLREIVRMLFYFHPAAWWAGKQLEVAIEIACDRAVITNEIEAADYAKRLYEILDAVRNRRRQPIAGGLFATRSLIARRLQMLVESPLRLRPGLTKTAVLGILLLAVMVLAVGSGFRREVNAQDAAAKSPADNRAKAESTHAVQPGKKDGSPANASVEGGVNVVGRIVDESGNPVAGVSVRLYAPDPDAATTKSDAEGRFQFLMRQRKTGRLVATSADDQRAGYANCYPVLDKKYAPQITLKPVREVTVKVVDALGAPVAGATYASPRAQYSLDNLLFTGKTGEDGTARLRFSDEARLYQVIAFKSGLGFDYFLSPRRPDQERREQLPGEITLTLAGARTLTIKAVDQKRQPVEGVRFSLERFTKPGAADSVFLGSCDAVEVTTNANGTAIFDWLPEKFADSLRFDCNSSEYGIRDPRRSIDLLWLRRDDPAKEWTVFVLHRTALSGKVVDQNGKPLPGIIVKASGIGADGDTGQGEAHTDSEGAYRMMVPSELAYLVEVVDNRWLAPARSAVVVHENQPVDGIDFKVDEGTILRGTVVDESGRPLANRQVVLLLQGKQIPAGMKPPSSPRVGDTLFYHHRKSKSDERGRFQFGVAPGTYKLAASEMGAVSSLTPQADVTIDAQREVVQDLRVQVDKTVRLKGSLVDPDGKPVADQRLLGSYLRGFRYDDGSFVPRTRPDGTFEVERKALPAVISVRIEDRKLGALARLDADQTEVTIQLRPLVEAHGRFLDEKGQGAPRRRISSAVEFPVEKGGQHGVLYTDALTDAQGRFTLRLLPGEEHTIRVLEDKPRVPVVTLTKVAVKGAATLNLGDLRIPPIPDQEAITLKGKVVGSDGKPVADAEVRALFLQSRSRGRARSARAKTSGEGTFEIKRPAVPAVISVRTLDNLLGGMMRIDDRQTEVSLTAVPLGEARGILTDSEGKAVPGSLVMGSIFIRVPAGGRIPVLEASATTAADGSYTLEGLLPGESYEVRYMVINDRRIVTRQAALATIKLEKAETINLGKTPLPP